jgi:hypothetical protein
VVAVTVTVAVAVTVTVTVAVTVDVTAAVAEAATVRPRAWRGGRGLAGARRVGRRAQAARTARPRGAAGRARCCARLALLRAFAL